MGQSWSGKRKMLEQEIICEALKGRIRYFITKYNNAHDESARFAVVVDGIEVIRGNEFLYYQKYLPMERQMKSEQGIPNRCWNGKGFDNDDENLVVENSIENLMKQCGEINMWQFKESMDAYLRQPIQDSLDSENPFIRMFAVLDRRVGKRTLEKLVEIVAEQPEWLQEFYNLRLTAEGIIPGEKEARISVARK